MGGTIKANTGTPSTEYVTIDQNTTGTTTLYAPTHDAEVSSVHIGNPGTTADIHLEITDGTQTVTLSNPAAADPIHYETTHYLEGGVDSLQVVVDTAEGAAQSVVAAVSRKED